ncbi:MAG: UDP-3-O-(3-hydroxymyristoyl)glucosamine N-acyltransferase [Planctomycetes bacterium]|nr:UDP-3-O-(3-hydroxymyristoyl)glucosamine N-acyltransferase [Planctomycetota bacterium]
MKTAAEIATGIGAQLDGDPRRLIERVRPIESAGTTDLTFLSRDKTPPPKEQFRAGAVIVVPAQAKDGFPEGTTFLRMENPHLGFARAIGLFYPAQNPPLSGIDPSARVSPDAQIGAGVLIGAFAVVEEGVTLGDRVTLYPGVYVGVGSRLAEDVTAYPRVTIYPHTTIGARTVIHAGTVIGSDGFGFVPTAEGVVKMPHNGRVRIEEDVEIGANSTIDRGVLDDTVIGRGSKLDNLVHIGHNCVVGPHCLLAGQTGLAGSCKIGAGVILAGQVGLAGHLEVGAGAQIGAKSGVRSDVPPGAKYFGYPATDFATAARAYAILFQLPDIHKKIDELAKRLDDILPPEE